MAYTYNDFLKAANSSGVMDRFSQEDLTVAQRNPEYGISMVNLMKDISGAGTPEQQLLATETANQMRKNYGIYGSGGGYAGSFGSQINDLMNRLNNYGSFKYENQDKYQQLLDTVASQQSFHYDESTDPTFSAYKKNYLREGDRAAANALAKASAASGGQASSYAVQAAQQANNYYAGQLADIIPTLQQNAYTQYLNDFSQKMSQLNALEGERAQAQEDWMNQYNMLLDSLTNLQRQDETDYQRYLDAFEQNYRAEQDEYDRALKLYNLLGYATPEVAKILGLPMPEESVVETVPGGTGGGPGIDGLTPEELEAAGRKVAESLLAGGSMGVSGALLDAAKGSNMTVTNRSTNDWVAIGSGRVTWPELAQLVASGQVVEIVDKQNGTVTYAYATGKNPQPQTQTQLPTPQKGTGPKSTAKDLGGNIHIRNDAMK